MTVTDKAGSQPLSTIVLLTDAELEATTLALRQWLRQNGATEDGIVEDVRAVVGKLDEVTA